MPSSNIAGVTKIKTKLIEKSNFLKGPFYNFFFIPVVLHPGSVYVGSSVPHSVALLKPSSAPDNAFHRNAQSSIRRYCCAGEALKAPWHSLSVSAKTKLSII